MQNEQHSIPATLQQQTFVVHFLQLQLGVIVLLDFGIVCLYFDCNL